MAGDWIRMRVWIDRDPKVQEMAAVIASDSSFCEWLCHPVHRDVTNAFEHVTVTVVRDVIVASLLRVWGVALERGDRAGADVVLAPCSKFAIDEIAGVPGMADAMEYVGWLSIEGATGIRLPNLIRQDRLASERKTGDPASSGAERTRKWRERHGDNGDARHGDVTGVTTEQNRTEDNRTGQTDVQSVSLSVPSGAVETTARQSVGKRNGKSAFSGMTTERLRDTAALQSWLEWQATLPSPVIDAADPESIVRLVAAAGKSLRRGKYPVRYFASLVGKRQWDALTPEDLQSAREALNGRK